MAAIFIETTKTENLRAIKKMAVKMGASITSFTKSQEEDFKLGKEMKKSEKSGKGDTSKFLKHIGLQ